MDEAITIHHIGGTPIGVPLPASRHLDAHMPGGGGGTGGAAGAGGSPPCGGCVDPTPLCDENNDTCVACLGDGDCSDPVAGHCQTGTCTACDDSAQCAHLTGTTVCDAGTCVECALGDETACGGATTCDLLAKTCTGAAPASLANCMACTNDLQCQASHRCVPMDFAGNAHGFYCLEQAVPTCEQPFLVPINRPSLSGATAVNYCGIDEDAVTCEAVLALVADWRCGGTDGMCSPDGIQPEVATPGALCRQVGLGANRCTYACASAGNCLVSPPGSTCGVGNPPSSPPSWCGG